MGAQTLAQSPHCNPELRLLSVWSFTSSPVSVWFPSGSPFSSPPMKVGGLSLSIGVTDAL